MKWRLGWDIGRVVRQSGRQANDCNIHPPAPASRLRMSRPNRREVLGDLIALSAASAPALASPGISAFPDAELIRLCEAHPAVVAAVNDHAR